MVQANFADCSRGVYWVICELEITPVFGSVDVLIDATSLLLPIHFHVVVYSRELY